MSTPAAFSGRDGLSRRPLDLLGEHVAPLDERRQPRRRYGEHLQTGVQRVERVLVRVGADGSLGGQQPHPALARRLDGGPGPRHDHAHDGRGERRLELRQSGGGGRVAGHHDELDLLAGQTGRGGEGQTAHLGEGLGAVGEVPRVAQVDEVLVGQVDQALVQHGQPAHPGVEDAYGSAVRGSGCFLRSWPGDSTKRLRPARPGYSE